MENFYDIIIAGGGPAGLSAAIYASRMGAKVAVIEGMAVGGQAALTPKVENYPARENASGFEITYDMQKQAESFGTVFVYGSIEKVSLKDDVKVREPFQENSMLKARLSLREGEFHTAQLVTLISLKKKPLSLQGAETLLLPTLWCLLLFRKRCILFIGAIN